ncbi:MAG: formyl transferase [Candidatus Helarchaeota archaeon]|nr:formyl transferase [Candidatus Helarchaeota archaeon]
MTRKKFFDPKIQKRPMRVAGFMSGSGTNIIKIIENQIKYKEEGLTSLYEVVLLFSDRSDFKKCRISEISNKYNIPFEANDIREFYRKKGYKDRRNMEVRKEYDQITMGYLEKYEIDCVALCGYMSIVTNVIFDRFPTINVHPADLSILNDKGRRKYTGEHTVRDAIYAGEKHVRSSTHLATAEVDGGPLLVLSAPLAVNLPPNVTLDSLKKEETAELLNQIADSHQDKLKELGDWVIFPKTLELLAQGLIEKDDKDKIFINESPAPLRL